MWRAWDPHRWSMAPCLRRYVTVFCITELANHSTCASELRAL